MLASCSSTLAYVRSPSADPEAQLIGEPSPSMAAISPTVEAHGKALVYPTCRVFRTGRRTRIGNGRPRYATASRMPSPADLADVWNARRPRDRLESPRRSRATHGRRPADGPSYRRAHSGALLADCVVRAGPDASIDVILAQRPGRRQRRRLPIRAPRLRRNPTTALRVRLQPLRTRRARRSAAASSRLPAARGFRLALRACCYRPLRDPPLNC